MRYIKLLRIGGTLAALTAAAGCASNAVESRADTLVRAQTQIQEAEQAGAYEHGGRELELAREKLSQARQAVEDGDEERADRLAMEAELDAELAEAMTLNAESQSALNELNDTISTLRQEVQRAE